MALLSATDFTLFADYYQFYLQDETVDEDLSNAWDKAATDRMLAVAPGVVGIGTARNMEVPLRLELHDEEPKPDLEGWDRVVECELRVDSGHIIVAGCTDYLPEAARVEVMPGIYGLRASYGSLRDISDDGLQGSDHYRVQLWPGVIGGPRILK